METERPFTGPIKAVVDAIKTGDHGLYAFTKPLRGTGVNVLTITFSLEKPVWEENDVPAEGLVVILDDVRRKRLSNGVIGWVAMSARYERISDNPRLLQE